MDDHDAMGLAMAAAASVRATTSPNPWVGAVVLDADGGMVGTGATQPPGGPHAEVEALREAGPAARGGTLVVTLEPCAHHGRTAPCTDAVIASGVERVVVGVEDPDPKVAGRGVDLLAQAGITVLTGVRREEVAAQLAPYLVHRRTGRPYVVLKLAMSLDGRTAAPDGSSRWITGDAARRDVHVLRAESDAVLVGAGTVRTDDPELTVRHVEGRDPLRVVLGHAHDGARVHPCLEVDGPLEAVLDHLGGRGVVQLLVEGGATVARSFHDAGLVDRYVLYVAPALFGGDDGTPLFRGPGAPTMGGLWRGRFESVTRLGDDVRLDVVRPIDHEEER